MLHKDTACNFDLMTLRKSRVEYLHFLVIIFMIRDVSISIFLYFLQITLGITVELRWTYLGKPATSFEEHVDTSQVMR